MGGNAVTIDIEILLAFAEDRIPPWKALIDLEAGLANDTIDGETGLYQSQAENLAQMVLGYRMKMLIAHRTISHMRIHHNADEASHIQQSEMITWYSTLQAIVMVSVTILQVMAIRG